MALLRASLWGSLITFITDNHEYCSRFIGVVRRYKQKEVTLKQVTLAELFTAVDQFSTNVQSLKLKCAPGPTVPDGPAGAAKSRVTRRVKNADKEEGN